MTGFLRLMLGDAAAAAKGETAASPQACGQETSYRAPKNHACNLGWQFRGQPGEGTKGQRGPQLSDPPLVTLGRSLLLSTKREHGYYI